MAALNDPKTINGWCFFDWANSAYSLVITSAIFPVYYGSLVQAEYGSGQVPFFGISLASEALYSFAISASFVLAALLSPVLSGIADYGGYKTPFMRFFTWLGAAACLVLFFFEGKRIELGILASVMASVGYAGALVFYNAYLPEIVSPDQYDRVSARGFSFGYGGSVLLLVLNLALIVNAEALGFTTGQVTRFAFVTVGLWWLGFSQITFARLPRGAARRPLTGQALGQGFHELQKVWQQLKHLPNTQRFLLSFFLYNSGVQTTIYLATLFGTEELKMTSDQLIPTILLLQVLAIAGAFAFARLSHARGNRFALTVILTIWVAVCGAAYFVYSATAFYVLAGGVGLVMGGVQSLSRATYTKLLPENTPDTASYFSFYDVLDKVSTVMGTAIYGLIAQTFGGMRNSTLALSVFFVAGLLVLQLVKVGKVPSGPTAEAVN
jgi:UMF1 family MFS transporter